MANNKKRTFTSLEKDDDDYKISNQNDNPNKKHSKFTNVTDDITFEDTFDDFENETIIRPNKADGIDKNNDEIKLDTSKPIITKNIKSSNHFNNNDNNNESDFKFSKVQGSCLELVWSEDDEMMEDMSEDGNNININGNNDNKIEIWAPNAKPKNGVQFTYDNKSYNVLHKFNMKWPCLSFDILYDDSGLIRTSVPYTMYLVTGTQADNKGQNTIDVLKLSQIQKTKYDDDLDDINEENDKEYINITDDEPLLQSRSVNHNKTVNRVRSHRKNPNLIATFSEDCNVYIYDLKEHILSLDGKSSKYESLSNPKNYVNKPIFKMSNNDEGYGLEWSPFDTKLLTGSCVGELCLIEMKSNSNFKRTIKFKTPKYSIEDIQFSPFESNIFVTCGTDNHIKIWDTRVESKRNCIKICKNAHNNDVNVVSWNKFDSFLLLSGSDDNSFKVWDLRKFINCIKNKLIKSKKIKSYAYYKYHSKPITSIEWSPFEKSSLIVSSEDNQLSIWDLSLEKDDETNDNNNTMEKHNNNIDNTLGNIPEQLVFTHCGQENIKEIHYHPQIPNMIMSSAGSGFHIFQPDNLITSFNNLKI